MRRYGVRATQCPCVLGCGRHSACGTLRGAGDTVPRILMLSPNTAAALLCALLGTPVSLVLCKHWVGRRRSVSKADSVLPLWALCNFSSLPRVICIFFLWIEVKFQSQSRVAPELVEEWLPHTVSCSGLRP